MSTGVPTAPFFRFPSLKHPPELVTYMGERNIGIFSTDMDSFDFKMRKPEQVVNAVMAKLKKFGKGIVLLHDFQTATSQAVPDLLAQLKAGGYKIVHMTGQGSNQDARRIRRGREEGTEAADGQHQADLERGSRRRLAAPRMIAKGGQPDLGGRPFSLRTVEGLAIVSADGMIADAAGVQPDALKLEADQRFFHDVLNTADVLVHGRHSGEGGPRAAQRRRIDPDPAHHRGRARPRQRTDGALEPGRRDVRRWRGSWSARQAAASR